MDSGFNKFTLRFEICHPSAGVGCHVHFGGEVLGVGEGDLPMGVGATLVADHFFQNLIGTQVFPFLDRFDKGQSLRFRPV